MVVDVALDQDEAAHELVRSLSRLPTSDLVQFTFQKPDVARVFASSLNSLAVKAASALFPIERDDDLTRSHIDILARLIERGDPSLARKFVPTHGSLVDLAAATSSAARPVLVAVLERLLDATIVTEILRGLSSQLKSILATKPQEEVVAFATIRTLARLSSSFLAACPAKLVKDEKVTLQAWTQTCIQIYDGYLPQAARQLDGDASANLTEPDLSKLDAQSWQLHYLTCRVDVLQLLSTLLEAHKASPSLVPALHEGLASTEIMLKKGGYSTLLNSTALLDLAATSDAWPSIRSGLLSDPSANKNRRRETLASIDTLATVVPKFTGAAWDAMQRFVVCQSPSHKGKARAQSRSQQSAASEEVLASVDSVLPHFGLDRLTVILSRPSFAGQSAEMVIQRLLDGDEGELEPTPQASFHAERTPSPRVRPDGKSSTSSAPSLVKSRANLFGDFGFDPSSIVQPKLARDGKVDELAPELKAAILARAEAGDDDEADEEWNPFSEGQRTVGIEDELDLDYHGNERSAAPRPAGHEDDDDDEHDGGEDGGNEDARMRERVLLKHYVQHGSHSFAADPTMRKSEARRKLKEHIGWSDDLIESWAIMLDRNPKKDKLLAAASQSELDEQLAALTVRDSSRNATDTEDGQQSARRWGPDRGRGGRIMGGGGRAHSGTDHAGGGRGGSAHVKNATRGRGTGNSGTNRAARHKEKAGNKARQKGHDKKVARLNA